MKQLLVVLLLSLCTLLFTGCTKRDIHYGDGKTTTVFDNRSQHEVSKDNSEFISNLPTVNITTHKFSEFNGNRKLFNDIEIPEGYVFCGAYPSRWGLCVQFSPKFSAKDAPPEYIEHYYIIFSDEGYMQSYFKVREKYSRGDR